MRVYPPERAPEEFKRIRNTVRGVQLNELTIGILGMGRVGRRVGRAVARDQVRADAGQLLAHLAGPHDLDMFLNAEHLPAPGLSEADATLVPGPFRFDGRRQQP